MIDLVLDQLGEIGRKVIPAAQTETMIPEGKGDRAVTPEVNEDIGHAQAVVPDQEGLLTSPGHLGVDEDEGTGAEVHGHKPLHHADLDAGNRAAEAASFAEVAQRGDQF